MANEAQVEYWNGEAGTHWTEEAEAMDGMLAEVGAVVLARAGLSPGERVLDVGCGSGALTLMAQQRVGATGQAIGIDISTRLLANAERRATQQASRAQFISADASSWRADAQVDVVLSRFGVMFFDQPTAAFANILRSVKSHGRMVFACWRSPRDNDLASGIMQATAHLFPAPAEKPDPRAPGPFAFADRDYLTGLLTTAGWHDVEFETWDGALPLPRASAHENAEWLTRLGPVARLRAEHPSVSSESITAALTPFLSSRERDAKCFLQGAAWIVTANSRH
jgi:ubiquinone/menaquinone biosynthesis C-methylase UbiE